KTEFCLTTMQLLHCNAFSCLVVPPSIANSQTNVTVIVNVQTTLPCEASGIPKPTVSWLKKGRTISLSLVLNIIFCQKSFFQPGDAGSYTCFATNAVGQDSWTVNYSSLEPPIIDGDLHSNRVEPLGGNTILNCEVRGDPPPTIQWSKNGVNIQISNRIRQMFNDFYFSSSLLQLVLLGHS
uniref:Ig-like domain-containing protein n=1 Tax=Oryzias latipes TaxID=8090 RepID=A0A3P9HGW2_ORYLA